MKEFLDRVPGEGMANRKKLTYENGDVQYVFVENADNPVTIGTPLNREALMAIQGFSSVSIEQFTDGRIVETNEEGHTLTSIFKDNQIIQIFEGQGQRTLTKTITMSKDTLSRTEVVE